MHQIPDNIGILDIENVIAIYSTECEMVNQPIHPPTQLLIHTAVYPLSLNVFLCYKSWLGLAFGNMIQKLICYFQKLLQFLHSLCRNSNVNLFTGKYFFAEQTNELWELMESAVQDFAVSLLNVDLRVWCILQ